MRIKRPTAVLALALTVAVTGCAPAVSATAASTATTTTAAPGRNKHITLYSINSDGPAFRAIVTGTVGDHGQAASVYPDGRIDPEHDSDLSLRLTRGSFLLNGVVLDRRFVTAFRRWRGNPATCSGSATPRGPSWICPGTPCDVRSHP